MTRQSKNTSLNQKLEIYRATRNRYRQWYADQAEHGGGCFYWTLTLMGVLLQKGYRALIQAGSMSWPIVPPGQDDGKSPTHFFYEWSPWREKSHAALRLGLLPEIHVWVGLPDQNELLDFATKFLPEQAVKEGLIWRTPLRQTSCGAALPSYQRASSTSRTSMPLGSSWIESAKSTTARTVARKENHAELVLKQTNHQGAKGGCAGIQNKNRWTFTVEGAGGRA